MYKLPTTGLRFFTVYGPRGRPDMAIDKFLKSIHNSTDIEKYGNGESYRDYTYIDDIVEVIWRCCKKPATPDVKFDRKNPNPSLSFAPHRIFNVGNGSSINLLEFIETLESELGIKAKKVFKPIQKGDVIATHADSTKIHGFGQWLSGFRLYPS